MGCLEEWVSAVDSIRREVACRVLEPLLEDLGAPLISCRGIKAG